MKPRRRIRIAKGIYRDRHGLAAIVRVRPHPQLEKRFPFGTAMKLLQRWQNEERVRLGAIAERAGRGTLKADVQRYLKLIKHLVSYKSRVSELAAWTALYPRTLRSALTRDDVMNARKKWQGKKYAPKTINHRVATLRHLYRTLDGSRTTAGARAWTPCDDIPKLPEPESRPVHVDVKTIQRVLEQLTDAKVTARFMVLAATGVRPSELARALAEDVDLERGFWMVRTGKGGYRPPMPLNADMLAAWDRFIAADAWGAFDVSDYDKQLYAAGWPTTIRPYNVRHSFGSSLSEAGADLADVQQLLGHRRIETTRSVYVPPIDSRLRAATTKIAGRFGWQRTEVAGNAAVTKP